MATKKELINNLCEYSVEEVAQAIREGVVTLYELSKSGHLSPLMRRRIEQNLAKKVEPTPAAVETQIVNESPASIGTAGATGSPVAESATAAESKTMAESTTVIEQSPALETQPVVETPIQQESYITPSGSTYQPASLIQSEVISPAPIIQETPVVMPSEEPMTMPQTPPPYYGMPSEPMAQQPMAYQQPTPTQPMSQQPMAYQQPEGNSDFVFNGGMFKRPFSFRGRIRRTEFGLTLLIYVLWYIFSLLYFGSNTNIPLFSILLSLSFIPVTWVMIAQSAKRCHDRGNSGWYQLIPFYYIVLLFGDGESGINQYGTNPKS